MKRGEDEIKNMHLIPDLEKGAKVVGNEKEEEDTETTIRSSRLVIAVRAAKDNQEKVP